MSPSIPRYHIENICAILNVSDMQRSLHFYVDILGFRKADWGDEHFTSVNRNNTGFYLCKNGQGQPGTWVWVGFDGDIFELQQYLQQKGVTIVMPPTNFSWAYEMHVADPDGHVLRFGSAPDDEQPFADRTSQP